MEDTVVVCRELGQTTLGKLLTSIDTIDYVTKIGNSSCAPIVIVDFTTALPGCDFLLNLCRIPAFLTEGVH